MCENEEAYGRFSTVGWIGDHHRDNRFHCFDKRPEEKASWTGLSRWYSVSADNHLAFDPG